MNKFFSFFRKKQKLENINDNTVNYSTEEQILKNKEDIEKLKADINLLHKRYNKNLMENKWCLKLFWGSIFIIIGMGGFITYLILYK